MDVGAPHGTSQLLPAPTMRPGWDTPELPPYGNQISGDCTEVSGLDTTRDSTSTHNQESKSITGFGTDQDKPLQQFIWARGIANNPCSLRVATQNIIQKAVLVIDGVKAEQSNCQQLLLFWGRTMLKNPRGTTDKDRPRM